MVIPLSSPKETICTDCHAGPPLHKPECPTRARTRRKSAHWQGAGGGSIPLRLWDLTKVVRRSLTFRRWLFQPSVTSAPAEDFGDFYLASLDNVDGTKIADPQAVERYAMVAPAVPDIRSRTRAEWIHLKFPKMG